jgi:hypothetical protein
LLGTPSVQSIHDFYPFAMEDGGRLAPMGVELVDRLAILVVVRRFPDMGAVDSRSLRSIRYVRMQHFVRRSTYVPFRCFWGDVFLSPRRFSGGQCRRCGMPSCSSGLGFFLFSSFCLVASTAFSRKKKIK